MRHAILAAALVALTALPVAAQEEPAPDPRAGCEPAYPTICVPPAPPDLNCPDILDRDFTVLQPRDPHRFDADKDGIGCESTSR